MNVFKQLRKEKGITQVQLAKMLQVQQTTVSKWEVGRAIPDYPILMKMAEYYAVSIDYLLGRDKQIECDTDANAKVTNGLFKDSQLAYSIRKMGRWKDVESTMNQANNVYAIGNLIIFEEIGTVCAGFNGSVDEIPTGRKIEIPASMISGGKKDDYFVLRVKGNSMYPRLLEGDTILCKRCEAVDSGSLAVVLYNGDEATVKKISYDSGRNWLELIPINPEYPTKRIEGADLDQCRILGLVVKLIRDL